MRILYTLIRIAFYYLLFLFIFKAVIFFIKLLFHRPDKYEKYDAGNKSHRKEFSEDKFDYKNVVDAEFEEMK